VGDMVVHKGTKGRIMVEPNSVPVRSHGDQRGSHDGPKVTKGSPMVAPWVSHGSPKNYVMMHLT
jgi:hypothetical protein